MAQSIITLSCPSCGANLELKAEIEQMTCAFCGKALFVNRGDDTFSLEPGEQRSDRAGTVTQREQTPKPEVVQEDLRVHQRLADELLYRRVQEQRSAAEASWASESLRLNKFREAGGRNQVTSVAVIGCAFLIAACLGCPALSALFSAVRGDQSAAEAIAPIFFELCVATGVFGVGIFLLWLLLSAARRKSAQIQLLEQRVQAAGSEVERLRKEEAQVRGRLAV